MDCRDEKREVIERELRKTFHEVAYPYNLNRTPDPHPNPNPNPSP